MSPSPWYLGRSSGRSHLAGASRYGVLVFCLSIATQKSAHVILARVNPCLYPLDVPCISGRGSVFDLLQGLVAIMHLVHSPGRILPDGASP